MRQILFLISCIYFIACARKATDQQISNMEPGNTLNNNQKCYDSNHNVIDCPGQSSNNNNNTSNDDDCPELCYDSTGRIVDCPSQTSNNNTSTDDDCPELCYDSTGRIIDCPSQTSNNNTSTNDDDCPELCYDSTGRIIDCPSQTSNNNDNTYAPDSYDQSYTQVPQMAPDTYQTSNGQSSQMAPDTNQVSNNDPNNFLTDGNEVNNDDDSKTVNTINQSAQNIKQDIDSQLNPNEANTTACTATFKSNLIESDMTVTLLNNSTDQTLRKICDAWRNSLTNRCGRQFQDCMWMRGNTKRQAGAVYTGSTVSYGAQSSGSAQVVVSVFIMLVMGIALRFI